MGQVEKGEPLPTVEVEVAYRGGGGVEGERAIGA